jgi:hypothetical protein
LLISVQCNFVTHLLLRVAKPERAFEKFGESSYLVEWEVTKPTKRPSRSEESVPQKGRVSKRIERQAMGNVGAITTEK